MKQYRDTEAKNWPAIINALVSREKLTPKGAIYVNTAITAAPSRAPSNASGMNLLVDFASTKMGHTGQLESLTVEAAYAQTLESAVSCIGYFPQPTSLKISYTDADGVTRPRWVTFDFLVVETDGVYLVECKTDEEALKLSKTTPKRYHRDESGRFTSPEAEKALEEYGIKPRIVTRGELNPTLLRNLTFLAEAQQSCYSQPNAISLLRERIRPEGLPLDELLNSAGKEYTKNDVFFGISCGDLHALLDACLLVDYRTTRVFSQKHHAEVYRALNFQTKPTTTEAIVLEPGTELRWNDANYTVCNASQEKVYLLAPKGGEPVPLPIALLRSLIASGEIKIAPAQIFSSPILQTQAEKFFCVVSSKHIARARARQQFLSFHELAPSTKPEDFGLHASRRTIQRWLRRAEESRDKYGTAFWGLIDQPRPGRPRDELPAEMRMEMTKFADELYFSKEKRSRSYVWRALRNSRRQRGLDSPSLGAFRKHVSDMRTAYSTVNSRDGERAAYQFSAVESDTSNWVTEADFPFKVGQLDGKLMDIALVDEETGESLGRPTLTLVTLPGFGAAPIGWTTLFEPESYRSATLAVRDAMERHGEAVKYLIVDNGRAFGNATFDKLLGTLETNKINRRPRDPRFASEIESVFRTIDREFIHNLVGNTQALQSRETATAEMDPGKRAVWTFQKFHARLEEYLLSLWDAPSAKLGTTPRKALERARKFAPDRQARFVLPPDLAKIAYLPEVDGRTRVVQPGRGVYIEGYYYWCPEMKKPSVERTKVVMRYDPFDLYVAFAAIEGKWIECRARRAPELRNVTERTRRIASLVKRTLRNSHHKRREASHGAVLGKLGEQIREEEKLLREVRRANAQMHALGKAVLPVAKKRAQLPNLTFAKLKRKT